MFSTRFNSTLIVTTTASLLVGLGGTASAQTSEYYMVSGDQATFTVVQNGQIIRQWSVASGTDNYQYPLAVRDTVRALGADTDDYGAEYDLNGNDLGTRYYHEANGPGKCWDGTTDGASNFAIDTGGYIWQFDLDWTNPTQLFRVNSLGSLTYDPENDSLWVTQFSSTGRIVEYTKAGAELRSFDTGHDNCMAIALDPADDTLWIHDRNVQGTIENWTKDGVLLDRMAVPGLEGFNSLGGEFAFGGAAPPNLAISGDCPGLMTFTAGGMTADGNVAFAYAFGEGNFVIPGGPCAGTTLGLDASVQLGGIANADRSGTAVFEARVPGAACGRVFVQAVDISSCATTNVVGI